jgi:hypothetical protein
MNTDNLIAKITKAISYKYKDDGMLPGITIAWLAHSNEHYASIVRWVGGEKEVICSAKNANLPICLATLAGELLAEIAQPKTPVDELSELIEEMTKTEIINERASPKVVSQEILG